MEVQQWQGRTAFQDFQFWWTAYLQQAGSGFLFEPFPLENFGFAVDHLTAQLESGTLQANPTTLPVISGALVYVLVSAAELAPDLNDQQLLEVVFKIRSVLDNIQPGWETPWLGQPPAADFVELEPPAVEMAPAA